MRRLRVSERSLAILKNEIVEIDREVISALSEIEVAVSVGVLCYARSILFQKIDRRFDLFAGRLIILQRD